MKNVYPYLKNYSKLSEIIKPNKKNSITSWKGIFIIKSRTLEEI